MSASTYIAIRRDSLGFYHVLEGSFDYGGDAWSSDKKYKTLEECIKAAAKLLETSEFEYGIQCIELWNETEPSDSDS